MFKDTFNQYKNLSLSDRIYYIERNNSNLFTGKVTEDIVKKMIHTYPKEISIWRTLYRNKFITYILGYEKDFDYDSIKRLTNIYKEDNMKVVFLLIKDNYHQDIYVKIFNENQSVTERLFDDFLDDEYSLDWDLVLSDLSYKMDNVDTYSNIDFENYISYINQNHYDNIFYKYESFIFGDLFNNKITDIKIFSMNYDIICDENSIVECKGKTRNKENIFKINKWEFEQLRSLYMNQKCQVNIYVLLSDSEKETRNNLLLGKGLNNNVELYTLQLNHYIIEQFKLDKEETNEFVYTIPYMFFDIVNSPVLKDLKTIHYSDYINTRPQISNGDNKFFDKINFEIEHFFCENPIFKDVQVEHQKNNLIVTFDNKKLLCKYVFDMAWSSSPIDEDIMENYEAIGITHIAFFKFYKKDDNPKCYDFLGYESLDEFKNNANKVSFVEGLAGFKRNPYLEHMNKTESEHNAIVEQQNVNHCYKRSLIAKDVAPAPISKKFNMKPFVPLHFF
jgi:hypothetical protein